MLGGIVKMNHKAGKDEKVINMYELITENERLAM